ncbi:selenocysteine lyase isoform X1 [Amblyraja radiata]|uniref:selenocysteine lyase isoform X1 n=1 Tax=Amblyraja radiata TaxID=386614 RepID=UPI001402E510|nr:selenocysteine lyase isoform X1 [Amblyraja radiata]XP_032887393.1 selenocysteine lyase isoform X1 [Amblyraja radiata]XP_032887394.1 selenocysteine lyase isoform X1 [Amblyraja radiata]XP_032887395.1 selenocysteine lyase isoform X1 [Amblyraja radiata]
MEKNACPAKTDGPSVTQGCPKLAELQQKNNSANEYSIYMDYNATTPMESEVMQTITEAMQEAWGNPSSSYAPGRNAKVLIDWARETIAQMVGGHPEDIIFTSGGTEANNLVIHTAVKYFWDHQRHLAPKDGRVDLGGIVQVLPHIITSNVEHDSVHLVVENLVKEGKAKATFLPVSKVTGCIQVDDVIAAIGPSTCLISIMLANNETGVLMPIAEMCQRVKIVNHQRGKQTPKILLHTDAAQALGKLQVDVQDLGVDYLTVVGHKFYGPRIGALYVRGPSTSSPVYAMFIGGGQERKFRPGTENTPMIAGLGKAAELVVKKLEIYASHMKEVRDYLEVCLLTVFGKEKLHFNSHFQGSDCLPNTCNVSILGPNLQGRNVLLHCQRLLASVGAACHSENVNRPSHVLLNSGIPYEVAENAIRLSVGRATSKEDVDTIVEDLKLAVKEIKLCAAQT